jgi:hypothetical protein
MMDIFQNLLSKVGGAYKQADKAAGGWLPGGGTAAPPVRAMQAAVPIAGRFAGAIRDQTIIPILDKGIETGILPTKETMFARYLTGTNKPLTVYPQFLLNDVSKAYDQAAIETTRNEVDKIFKQNPLYRQYETTQNELNKLSTRIRNQAEMTGVDSSVQDRQKLKQYEQKTNELRQSLNLPDYNLPYDRVPETTLSNQERLSMIQKNNLVRPGNVTFGSRVAYGLMPEEVALSLGRFNIKDNKITDRYKFDDLQAGRQQITGAGNVYPDAEGGGVLGSDLIELGLKTKILNPNSGYDIRIPYLK